MNEFNVVEIIDSNTIRVEPSWQLTLNTGVKFMGDRVVIRGLDVDKNSSLIKERLQKLLINSNNNISFNSPELVDTESRSNAIVSCSVYLAKTPLLYYFPEFVHV